MRGAVDGAREVSSSIQSPDRTARTYPEDLAFSIINNGRVINFI